MGIETLNIAAKAAGYAMAPPDAPIDLGRPRPFNPQRNLAINPAFATAKVDAAARLEDRWAYIFPKKFADAFSTLVGFSFSRGGESLIGVKQPVKSASAANCA